MLPEPEQILLAPITCSRGIPYLTEYDLRMFSKFVMMTEGYPGCHCACNLDLDLLELPR